MKYQVPGIFNGLENNLADLQLNLNYKRAIKVSYINIQLYLFQGVLEPFSWKILILEND